MADALRNLARAAVALPPVSDGLGGALSDVSSCLER